MLFKKLEKKQRVNLEKEDKMKQLRERYKLKK